MENLYPHVKPIIQHAWEVIMEYYEQWAKVETKSDWSFVTEADKAANDIIVPRLVEILDCPVVSEEWEQKGLDQKQWYYRLVDPLDGTKSFVHRNGDFNVDIALMYNHKPVFSVIYDPVREIFYTAQKWLGSYKEFDGNITPLIVDNWKIDSIRFINSRPDGYLDLKQDLRLEFADIEEQRVFSAYKFCLMAEDKWDLYAHNCATHHWDTAAWELIATEAWLKLLSMHNNAIHDWINYNTQSTLNDSFIVYKPWTISDQIIKNFLLN